MNDAVVREIRVRCDLEHAFRVFTSRIDIWWPPSHRRGENSEIVLEPGRGGRFLERRSDGSETVHGHVVSWDPPHSLAYTWLPGSDGKPTRVDVTFRSVGAETLVHVVHQEGDSGLGKGWPDRAQHFGRAWDQVLPCFGKATKTQ